MGTERDQTENPEDEYTTRTYKGSAPRADAARYARARKNATKTCKGSRRGPWFGANSDLIMPRAACAEQIALCCAVCLLAVSRSDRQY